MENVIVKKAWKDRDEHGIIIHETATPDGTTNRVNYTAVVGGISWPSNNSPAYGCILGQLWDGNVARLGEKRNQGALKFLGEYHSESLSSHDFFNKITDGATMFYCDRWFADLSEEFSGYHETLKDFLRERNVKTPHLSIKEAAYADNFPFGIRLIMDWRKEGKIAIPEDTLIHKQITSISREDLEDSPERVFWAINALRFVVGAFQKYDYRPIYSLRRASRPRNWMTL